MADQPFDLIIVGSGHAGCTLAGKIAEHGVNPLTGEPLRIALMDRGPYFKGEPRPGYGHPSRRRMFTNISLEFAQKYRFTGGLTPGGRRKVALKPGEEVSRQGTAAIFGGGTLHYTAVTRVPFDLDYDVWGEETGTDWNARTVRPFGEQITRDYNIHARPDVLITPLDRMFRDTARSMGYAVEEATIAKKNCLLSGYCDGPNMCRYDARMGSFLVYLPIAEERGVEMMPDCHVERVLFEKSGARVRVQGVEYTQAGKRLTLAAPRVLVSAGTYSTPVILYRSGYGPRELTEGDPIVENRNVGAHTDNRPQVQGPVGVFDEPVSDGEFHHTGAYYATHDTTSDRRYERIQMEVSPYQVPYPDRVALNAAAPEFGREHKEFMREVWNSSKTTPGRRQMTRQAVSTLRLVRPRRIRGYINEWYEQIYRRNDPSILKPLEEGRELIYEMLKKMGAKQILGMDRPLANPYLATFVGSCIGGSDPKSSVVDPHFQSHDIEGLFVCCGSTVPRAASQGYAGSVATLALFAAHRIVERNFKRG